MKKAKLLAGVIALIVVLIQFIPVNRSNPPVTQELQADAEIMQLLKRSCYDCHSNQTDWPWYSYVAPVSWLITRDVKEAREDLNFTEWDQYKEKEKRKLLQEIVEEVEEEEMPLKEYIWLHPEAGLSVTEVARIRRWVEKDERKGQSFSEK